MTWRAEVRVLLKPSVNDPQGLSVLGALHTLGFEQVEGVRVGKLIVLDLEAVDRDAAAAAVDSMCSKLLANPVIEQYQFELTPKPAS